MERRPDWSSDVSPLEGVGELASTGDLVLHDHTEPMHVELDADGRLKAPRDRTRQLLRTRLMRAELLPTGLGWAVLRTLGTTPAPSLRARAELEREVVMAGTLGEAGLALIDVIGFLAQGQQTGELTVTTDDVVRSVFLLRGDLVWASSTAPEDTIGELLVRRGWMTKAALAELLATDPARVGRLSVERGLVAAHELWGLVQQQLREIFEAALAVERGVWAFARASEESFAASQVILPTQALLLDAMRRLDELRLYREVVRSATTEVRKVEPPPDVRHDTARLEQAERDLLASVYRSIRGPANVLALMHASGRSEFEVTRAVYRLCQLGLVAVVEERTSTSAGVVHPRPSRPLSHPEAHHIVGIYSLAMREVFGELGRTHETEPLHAAVRGFLAHAPVPHAAVLGGARLGPDGALDERSLVAALAPHDVTAAQVAEALSELLFFALFEASEALGPRRRDDLARRVKMIQGMLAGGDR